MMIKFKLAVIAIIMVFTQNVLSQTKTVKGLVTDEFGTPLPGVSILVKGASNGTSTDFDGKYELKNVRATDELVFAFIGMISQTILVGNQTEINVSLKESAEALDEVVVIGYGTKKKSLVTGAISSIGSEQIQNASIQRVEQVLQGRTSGVTVVSSSGSPGSGAKVRIRGTGSNGNSEPLYIVDGMKATTIDNIAPSDIANIEVLKDAASSAIYGTQGANGVIIITTKQGKIGKNVISYNAQMVTQSLNTKMSLMNASQFVTYMNDAGQSISTNGIDTNWLNATFEDALMQRHDISFSGATEKLSYYISGSLLDQEGVVGQDNASYKRYTLRANIKSDVKKWLEVGVNLNYTNTNEDNITEDNDTRGVIQNMLIIDPLTPVTYTDGGVPQTVLDNAANNNVALMRDSNGNVYGYPTFSTGEVINPVAYANYVFRGDGNDTDRFLSSTYAKFKLAKGFSVTSRFGYERLNSFDRRWSPTYYVTSEAQNTQVTLSDNISRNSRWLWENFATYTQEIGEHSFTVLAGYSAEKINNPYYSLNGGDVSQATDSFSYFDFANRDNDIIGGSIYRKNMTSIFGRLSYNFGGKYLFEGSLRNDTSSVFPTENRSALFPAVSAGWVVSKEDFWNSDAKINYFKLRASWGQNGSDANLAGNGDIQVFRTVALSDGNVPVVYESVSGVTPGDLANPNLVWERSEQLDIGFDLRAFDNRLNFAFDYYKKTTRDLIIPNGNIIAPPSLGQTIGAINGGTIENTGLEFEFGYHERTESDFRYGLDLNLSTLKNRVTEIIVPSALVGAGAPQNSDGVTRFEEGEPVWYFYGYKTDGIDPATGEAILVDTNNDGTVDSTDKTNIGSPHPDIIYGGNINLGYKNIDLNMRFQGVSGNEIFAAYHQPSRPFTNKPVEFFEGRWTGAGDTDATFPGAGSIANAYDTDLMVQDGSYTRIKQIQLGYTISPHLAEKLKVSSLRLYVSLDDYFTFTKFKGLDPEAGSFADNSIGIDRGFYPIPRKTIFGLSVSF